MKTQSVKLILSYDGLCVLYDTGDNVSNLYNSPGEFKGEMIQARGITLKETPFIDLETVAKRLVMSQ